MAKEDQQTFNSTLVDTQGFEINPTLISVTASDTRSISPDSLLDAGDTFLTDCTHVQNLIIENSDTISAVSLESDYCASGMLDDISIASNTNSCPEFTRQQEQPAVFSERLQPSMQEKSRTAASLTINQGHKKIRRIPSGANPRHRVSTMYRPQRSQSVPHIQVNPATLPRRFSQQQLNQGGLPTIQAGQQRSSNTPGSRTQQQTLPQIHQKPSSNPKQSQQQSGTQQQQQQIIYLQIPNANGAQSCDSQELQQQIAFQLHQLVPQICSQLLQQMDPNGTSTQSTNVTSETAAKLNESVKTAINNQLLRQSNDIPNVVRRVNPKKRKKSSALQAPTEIAVEIESDSDSSSSPYQQPRLNQATPTRSATGIPAYPAIPQLTIPIPQELLLQCQQLREQPQYLYSYQPRLETIHEESLSLKHFRVDDYSKTKILACILTLLCVIVVIVLAGDRTVAVVIVTVIFIIFFLGLVGFLYLNQSRNESMVTAQDGRSFQVGGLPSSGSKSSIA